MIVTKINNKSYLTNIGELKKYDHNEFNYLKLYPVIGLLEKHTGLLKDIAEDIFNKECSLTVIGNNYGGFVPINCSSHFSNVHVDFVDIGEKNNIIYVSYDYNLPDYVINKINNRYIILSHEKLDLAYNFVYTISNNTPICSSNPYYLYVPDDLNSKFIEHFYYYLRENSSTLEYDNLINLCIMVKNGGDLFEKVLTENLPYIDRWTILDTGSTDNTVETIKKVMRHKKGKLYEEPFINFRDSRNRCLDLAGTTCKYNIMLDDTYVIRGQLREFLQTVRSDQFADSFSLLILSDDTEYYSNRITKSENNLRYIYKIHEVINNKNNINVVIPKHIATIFDYRADYMEKRTMDRKKSDLELLFEEVKENPNDPRHYYYIAQTYNLINEHEKAAEYFLRRAYNPEEGFLQEKVDSLFEAARIYNFKLNKPWKEVEQMYLKCHEWEPERPESSYFIGIHYYLEKDYTKAYPYFLKAFEIGYPVHKQFSLKPTLSFHFLPKFLSQLCYENKNYRVGEECTKLFLQNNKPSDDSYDLIKSWYDIFVNINKLPPLKNPPINDEKILCFLVDGGFSNWTGRDILTKGVGGSETWAIETARYIKKVSDFRIVFFCRCDKNDVFEGVEYYPIDNFFDFASTYKIDHCIVSRFSEYIPAVINSHVDNVYLMLHDLGPSGLIIPMHNKLKKVFCLSEWHKKHFLNNFPQMREITESYHYGIDHDKFGEVDVNKKIPYSFIYSSFPNRGLLILLKMWPYIKQIFPSATLNIYSDVFGAWANKNYPEEMKEIQSLLWDEKGAEKYYKQGIIYNSWVSKKELAEGWKKADVWFYPCKFAETFCLTALEAATTKTLAITNNLAALQNTVGDRGVSIEGDVTTQEWQNRALKEIVAILQDPERKKELVEKNYEWSKEHTWEKRAINFYNTYLIKD